MKWTTEKRKVNDLKPYEKNPRTITPAEEKKIADSLDRMNLVELPVVDTDNTIVAGHQRIAALKAMGRGEEEIEVRVPERKLTPEEFARYNVASNKISGEWNYDLLANFDEDILLKGGFTENDLRFLKDEDLIIVPEPDGTPPEETKALNISLRRPDMELLKKILEKFEGTVSDKVLAAVRAAGEYHATEL